METSPHEKIEQPKNSDKIVPTGQNFNYWQY